ncbi:MAG: winged helix-turn-helix transcriptional regulator [Bacteroidales bacterium]|nr:winged helix-turn-helix transcriptional regulator [Bacteroidales bacterium]
MRAAVLCFGKNAEKLITGAFVKIGFFRTHSDLLYQDVIEGSLIEQVEKTMDLLTTKYMKANINYEGITRTETYDYPENALREAVLNAIIHKDYSSNVPVQISVYDRWLMIYNSGRLPEGWTLETLMKKHSSIPANPDVARVFFRAGYIENWGRGISDIVKYCKNAGLPEPFYKQMGAGFALIFEKEKGAANFSYTSEIGATTQETTQATTQEKLSKSAAGILKLIEQNPEITRKQLADKLNDISEDGVKYNLDKLKKMGYIKRKGSTKSGSWVIIKRINNN